MRNFKEWFKEKGMLAGIISGAVTTAIMYIVNVFLVGHWFENLILLGAIYIVIMAIFIGMEYFSYRRETKNNRKQGFISFLICHLPWILTGGAIAAVIAYYIVSVLNGEWRSNLFMVAGCYMVAELILVFILWKTYKSCEQNDEKDRV